MSHRERQAAYASLSVLGLAFGWIEASTVVYLREIYMRQVSLQGTIDFESLQVTLVSLPDRLVILEMVREACTIVLLGAAAWLAGRRARDRFGAFLVAFGIWDLIYYAALKVAAGWPDTLTTWDILFLIPLPWVAPVWAPVTVAAIFTAAGSYVFWTPDRERPYRWSDFAILAAGALLTIAAFLVESGAVTGRRAPERFPEWLFWAGVALGTGWFLRVERRDAGNRDELRPRMNRVSAISGGSPGAESGGLAEKGADVGRTRGNRGHRR